MRPLMMAVPAVASYAIGHAGPGGVRVLVQGGSTRMVTAGVRLAIRQDRLRPHL
jgi:hypothetical protein